MVLVQGLCGPRGPAPGSKTGQGLFPQSVGNSGPKKAAAMWLQQRLPGGRYQAGAGPFLHIPELSQSLLLPSVARPCPVQSWDFPLGSAFSGPRMVQGCLGPWGRGDGGGLLCSESPLGTFWSLGCFCFPRPSGEASHVSLPPAWPGAALPGCPPRLPSCCPVMPALPPDTDAEQAIARPLTSPHQDSLNQNPLVSPVSILKE